MQINKKAFTLAEVLVTLAVIGVVASLTVPGIVKNYQEISWKTAYKKNYSNLAQVTNMIIADNGGTLKGAFGGTNLATWDIDNKYEVYLSTTKTCEWSNSSDCWHESDAWYELNGTTAGTSGDAPGAILTNGASLKFNLSSSICDWGTYDRCGYIYLDINGKKPPNTIGKDIFMIYILENRLVPAGFSADASFNKPENDCIEGSTNADNEGWGCSAKYLQE